MVSVVAAVAGTACAARRNFGEGLRHRSRNGGRESRESREEHEEFAGDLHGRGSGEVGWDVSE